MTDIEQGSCDICGEKADSNVQECNQLSCTFQHCPPTGLLYHQECLETFLRKNKLEKYVYACTDAAACQPCRGFVHTARLYHRPNQHVCIVCVAGCRNRKTGFKCPRGCGKGSKYDAPCPGRVSGLDVALCCAAVVCRERYTSPCIDLLADRQIPPNAPPQ